MNNENVHNNDKYYVVQITMIDEEMISWYDIINNNSMIDNLKGKYIDTMEKTYNEECENGAKTYSNNSTRSFNVPLKD